MNAIDLAFINDVEKAHFRTCHDTGANENARFIWNLVRQHVGLPRLEFEDLPAWCVTHNTYHKIEKGYGCVRSKGSEQFR